MEQTKSTANPKLYIGLDIHKRSWKIQTATDLFWGKAFTMPPRSETLEEYVHKNFPNYEVYIAYESGCCGYQPHRNFELYSWTSLVVNPGDIAKSSRAKFQKTDKIDAAMICRELKDGRLKSIHIPDEEREHLRCLFRRRNELVKRYRKIKSQLVMRLLYLGMEIPKQYDNSNWSHGFRDWIRSIKWSYYTVDFSFKNRMI